MARPFSNWQPAKRRVKAPKMENKRASVAANHLAALVADVALALVEVVVLVSHNHVGSGLELEYSSVIRPKRCLWMNRLLRALCVLL